ncbi:hypothetical protein A2U01_0112384, partial [Trifolium medium]|nr:hypothetical protein [Trifolium medium]
DGAGNKLQQRSNAQLGASTMEVQNEMSFKEVVVVGGVKVSSKVEEKKRKFKEKSKSVQGQSKIGAQYD